jgi:hypothetical protein
MVITIQDWDSLEILIDRDIGITIKTDKKEIKTKIDRKEVNTDKKEAIIRNAINIGTKEEDRIDIKLEIIKTLFRFDNSSYWVLIRLYFN